MKEILKIIHDTIYQFFDVYEDDQEVPMSDKDKLLLEVNKAICNNLKALEQEHRWISVSERLPKNDEDVLVCSSQGAMEVCYYHIDATFYPTEYADLNETGWYNEDDDVLGFEPIAWMSLPKPYSESEDNE